LTILQVLCFFASNMAITRNKKDSLVDTQMSENVVVDIKPGTTGLKEEQPDTPKAEKNQKKPGFIRTTIEELKKVQWPSFSYVIRWSGIIIMFTVVISLSLGFFDHLFTGSIKFVDCSSPIGQNQPLQKCGENLVTYLTFRSS
jgi:preprotein translocase SecE subunit